MESLQSISSSGFPVLVQDEYLEIAFAVVYSREDCNTPNTGNPHFPYDVSTPELENLHFREDQEAIYYDGNPSHLLTMFGASNQLMLEPVGGAANPGPLTSGDFTNAPFFHPDYASQLALPNRLKTAELFHPALPSNLYCHFKQSKWC